MRDQVTYTYVDDDNQASRPMPGTLVKIALFNLPTADGIVSQVVGVVRCHATRKYVTIPIEDIIYRGDENR